MKHGYPSTCSVLCLLTSLDDTIQQGCQSRWNGNKYFSEKHQSEPEEKLDELVDDVYVLCLGAFLPLAHRELYLLAFVQRTKT